MLFSLLQTLGATPLAFVDVETTGTRPEWGHRITEVGVVRIENGQVVAQYQQLIDPCRRLGPYITALTGITPQMLEGQPKFHEQLPALTEILRGAAVLGHNVRFDLAFLIDEYRRAGKQLHGELGDIPVFDTVRIARKLLGRRGNGLQKLSRRLGVEPTIAHRALADAQTTAQVFEKLLEPVGGWGVKLVDAMIHQGGPMRLDSEPAQQQLLLFDAENAGATEPRLARITPATPLAHPPTHS